MEEMKAVKWLISNEVKNWMFNIGYLCIGFSLILHNVTLLPTMSSQAGRLALATATFGIAVTISYFKLYTVFKEAENENNKKTTSGN